MTAAARPTPGYEAVLLVRTDAWPTFVRWLPKSGLVTTPVPARHAIPQYELAPIPTNEWPSLTARELDIIELIADGRDNSEIAAKLFVSVETVRTHCKRIYRKLEARSRAHAVHIAYQRGILGGGA